MEKDMEKYLTEDEKITLENWREGFTKGAYEETLYSLIEDRKKLEQLEKENEALKNNLKLTLKSLGMIQENSISKSEIRDKIEILENKIKIAQGEELLIFDSKLDILKEILGDE